MSLVSSALQGSFYNSGQGVPLGQALTQFLQWARHIHKHKRRQQRNTPEATATDLPPIRLEAAAEMQPQIKIEAATEAAKDHSEVVSEAATEATQPHPQVKLEAAAEGQPRIKSEAAAEADTEATKDHPAFKSKAKRSDAGITLVAHYGSGFHHKMLVQALQQHNFLPTAKLSRLCDSCIYFKVMRGRDISSNLETLAAEYAPHYRVTNGDGPSKAKALRAVSVAALGEVGRTPCMVWPRLSCPLHEFAECIQLPNVADEASQPTAKIHAPPTPYQSESQQAKRAKCS